MLADATEVVGDEIQRLAAWQSGSDLAKLAQRPIKLRFQMKDADLYSLRFRE